MFEHEIISNQLLIDWFRNMVVDIPAERMFEPAPGHGHPPVWILGHLAICGELGVKFTGGEITHPAWLPLFGPGSSNQIGESCGVELADVVQAVETSYEDFRNRAATADADAMSKPHGVELLESSPVQTVGQLVSHLLSSHFSFHLAQLSAWRRAAGKPALL